MKQPRVIQRFSSLLLATLLLFTAVWGRHTVAQEKALVAKKVVATQTQSGKATDPGAKDAQLSTAQFEAVVTPALKVGDSGQSAFLLPPPTLIAAAP